MRPRALGILYRQEGCRRLGVSAEDTGLLQGGRKAIRGIKLNHRVVRNGYTLEQIRDGNRLELGKPLLVIAVIDGDRLKVVPGQQLRLRKSQSLLVRNNFELGLHRKRVQ